MDSTSFVMVADTPETDSAYIPPTAPPTSLSSVVTSPLGLSTAFLTLVALAGFGIKLKSSTSSSSLRAPPTQNEPAPESESILEANANTSSSASALSTAGASGSVAEKRKRTKERYKRTNEKVSSSSAKSGRKQVTSSAQNSARSSRVSSPLVNETYSQAQSNARSPDSLSQSSHLGQASTSTSQNWTPSYASTAGSSALSPSVVEDGEENESDSLATAPSNAETDDQGEPGQILEVHFNLATNTALDEAGDSGAGVVPTLANLKGKSNRRRRSSPNQSLEANVTSPTSPSSSFAALIPTLPLRPSPMTIRTLSAFADVSAALTPTTTFTSSASNSTVVPSSSYAHDTPSQRSTAQPRTILKSPEFISISATSTASSTSTSSSNLSPKTPPNNFSAGGAIYRVSEEVGVEDDPQDPDLDNLTPTIEHEHDRGTKSTFVVSSNRAVEAAAIKPSISEPLSIPAAKLQWSESPEHDQQWEQPLEEDEGSAYTSTRPGSSSGMSSSEDAASSTAAPRSFRAPLPWSTPGPHGMRSSTRDGGAEIGARGVSGGRTEQLIGLGIGMGPSPLLNRTQNLNGGGVGKKARRASAQHVPNSHLNQSHSPFIRYDGLPASSSIPEGTSEDSESEKRGVSSSSGTGTADDDDDEEDGEDEERDSQPAATLDILFPSLNDPPPPPTPPYHGDDAVDSSGVYHYEYPASGSASVGMSALRNVHTAPSHSGSSTEYSAAGGVGGGYDEAAGTETVDGLKTTLERVRDRENKWRAECMRLAGEYEKLRWSWTEEASKWGRREAEVRVRCLCTFLRSMIGPSYSLGVICNILDAESALSSHVRVQPRASTTYHLQHP